MAKIKLDRESLEGFLETIYKVEILNYLEVKDEIKISFPEPRAGWGYIKISEYDLGRKAVLEIFSYNPLNFDIVISTSDDTIIFPLLLRRKYILDTTKYRFPEVYIQFLNAPYFKVIVEMLEQGINNLIYHFQDVGVVTTEQQVLAPRLIKGADDISEWKIQWNYKDTEEEVITLAPLENNYKDDDGWIKIPLEIIEELNLDIPKEKYRYIVKFDEFALSVRSDEIKKYLSMSDQIFQTDTIPDSNPELKFKSIVDFFSYFPTEFEYLIENVIKLNVNEQYVDLFFKSVMENIFKDNPEIGGDIIEIFVGEFDKAWTKNMNTESWEFKFPEIEVGEKDDK